jgi:ABC-2 type transport system permease protein
MMPDAIARAEGSGGVGDCGLDLDRDGGRDRQDNRASAGVWLRQELGVIEALWRRELLHLLHQRSRWLGVVLQPLLFWFIIGSGMAPSFRADTDVDYLRFLFPGIVLMVILFTAIFATISVIEDRKSGFLQGVLVAPGSRVSMILGKVAGVTSLVLIQVALMVLVAPLAGYSLGDISWNLLLVTVVLSSAGLTCTGVMMAWRLNSAQAYHAMMSVILLPLWIVSGAMFPTNGSWVKWVAIGNPMSYSVIELQAAFEGASATPANLLVLLGFALFALWLAHSATRRKAP